MVTALLCALALAADPAAAPKPKKAKPALALDIPKVSMPELPKSDGLQKAKEEAPTPSTSSTTKTEDAAFSVVKVEFAKAFTRKAQGNVPVGPMPALVLHGNPMTTEKFSSLVRVKCPQKASAPIELVFIDARGDTAMSAQGQLTFKGATGDEVEYMVDWDPTPCRAGGKFQLLVRIGGQPMGSWPLQVEEKP